MKKICTKCKENKPLEEYSKDARKKNGRKSECKSCHNVMQMKYRKTANGEMSHVKYNKSDRGKAVYAKANAKYQRSDKGKTIKTKSQAKYYKTGKGKAARARGNANRSSNKKQTINNLEAKEFNCVIFLQNYQCIGPDHEGSRFFDMVEPTRDHIVPASKGGDFIKENIQALCQSCNSKKRIQEIDYRSTIHKQIITKFKL